MIPSCSGVSDLDGARTRLFCAAYLVLAAPFLVVFAGIHFAEGDAFRGWVLAGIGAGMFGLLLVLRTTDRPAWVYRACIVLMGVFSLYLVGLSARLGNGDRLLFFTILPLFSFFTLGKKEGLFWVLGLFGLWVPILTVPVSVLGTTPLPTGLVLRFVVTFVVVSGMTYAFESIRREYERGMEEKRANLETEIWERERIQRDLEKSEAMYRTLFEAAGDACFLCEIQGEGLLVRDCNEAGCRLFGGAREELIGRTTEAFDAPMEVAGFDLADRRSQLIAQLVSGSPQRVEWVHRRSSGEPFPTEVVLTRIDLGEAPHVLAVVRDMSVQKENLATLRESQKRFRETAALLPEVVFETDAEGVLTFVNENAYAVTGYGKDQMSAGFHVLDLIAPEDVPRARANVRKRLEGEDFAKTEYTALRRDGSRFPILVRSKPIVRDGEVIGLRGVMVDFTRQKEVEQELREGKEFLEALMESLPGNFYVLGEEGATLLWNRRVEEVSGYGPDELAVMSPETFFAKEDRERVAEEVRKAFAGEGVDFEARIRTKDGKEIPYHYFGVTSHIGGRKLLIGLGFDVSARKMAEQEANRLEERLRRSEKMEAIGTLAGGVSHEFNNILAIITGFAELAAAESVEGSLQKENLEEVLDAAKRGRDLVGQVLSFSRQDECDRGAVELQSIVKGTLKHVRDQLPGSIRLEQRLEAESRRVLGNAVEFHRMLLHLCRNAEEAMRAEGGVMEVSLTEDHLDPEGADEIGGARAGAYLKLVVADTGPGMDANVAERVFDPFFTTKGAGEGTGMGLSVVHGIVEGMGGRISVATARGKGSTFSVWLPVMDASGQPMNTEKELAEVKQNGGRAHTILVVDDEVQIRRMLRQMLEREGFRVLEAADGTEALRSHATEPADLVITDIFMPETDGFETIRELRKGSPEIGIIAISGGGKTVKEDLLPYAEMLGADRIMAKPLDRGKLMEAIREVRRVRGPTA